jgi:hypothetical protein
MKLINLLIENLDLNNKDSIISWINKNGPESIFDDQGEIDWNYTDPKTGDSLDELIQTYMQKYNEIESEYEIEVYRMVKLEDIKQLDLKNIGVFWSFDQQGIGAYGLGKKFTGSKPYIISAIVKTEDIDWEQGFHSFLSYGTSEFECNMKKGASCLIIAINEKELKKPIKGIC